MQLDLFSHGPSEPTVAQAREAEAREGEAREGERQKRIGMERAAWGKERLLGHAREIAHDVATGILPRADGKFHRDGLVTADDVAAQWERENEQLAKEGHPPIPWLGNAAGHIFQDENWVWTGKLVKSYRAHAHRNLLREWRRRL